MSKKVERHSPSWAEVILGAFLSLVLGVALGAVLLILRPAVSAKDEPKERVRDTVYFIEGAKDVSKAKQALAKRKAFVEGQSVTVTEDEINALLSPPAPAAPPAKGAEKGKEGDAAKPAGDSGYFTAGTPNVRIREGVLQVGVPVTVDLLGEKIIAQARGAFVKQGDVFVFEPTEMYLGSCPVQRVPFLSSFVRGKFLDAQPIPEDIKSAWPKLAAVTIEGNAVKLTMP
jgi:hypothetical protein